MAPTVARGVALGLAVCALGVIAAPARARAAETWTPFGPPGGDVRSMAADPRDPRVLYLGTADGIVYRSDDGGLQWRRTSPGFPRRGVSLDDLEVDKDGTVYVAYWQLTGEGGGVAKSTDGGRTFAALAGMEGQGVRAFAIAPSDPRVLVAGTLGGIFRSSDAGASWQRISPPDHEEIRNLDSVAIDPASPDVVYAGTWHLPWKTSDGGRTWAPIHAGMIDDSDVMTMNVDVRDRRLVYATACSGIYRSADAGARWAKIRGIPSSSRRTRAFAQDPARPGTFYAGTTEGLWVSDDDTASWRLATPSRLVINAVVVLPGGVVLLGCDGAGVLRSSDRGRTWAAANDGFSARFVSRVVFDAPGSRMLAAILGDREHGGVFTARTPGAPWSRLGGGLEGRDVLALARAGASLLAGTDDGLFVSARNDGGWQRLETRIDGIDAHPRITDVVALDGPAGRGSVIVAASTQGLLRSADGGRSWEGRRLGLATPVLAVAAAPSAPGTLAAVTPLAAFTSTDGGASWTERGGTPDSGIHALAFLPGGDKVLFVTTPRGLYRSPDQGATWAPRGGGLPLSDITGLALHPDGRVLYVSDFARGGIYKSEDGGDSWTRMSTDGLASDRVWGLALDPASPALLIATAPAGGLHRVEVSSTGALAAGSR
jgi:photosystem II stability/assembly factor-like uncharacterized protein